MSIVGFLYSTIPTQAEERTKSLFLLKTLTNGTLFA